jgi:NADH dehydrogenase FAD-containing subunit
MRLQSVSDTLNPLANLSITSPHRVLIVGCAYGGLSALVNLLDLAQGKPRDTVYPVPDFSGRKSKNAVEITVIDERDGYCMLLLAASTSNILIFGIVHSVGAPLAHVTLKHTPSMWKRYSRLNELRHSNLKFKHGTVKNIDPELKIAEWQDRSGEMQQHSYDYVIIATGLKRQWPAVPKSGSYEEFLRDSRELINKITGGDPNQKDRKIVVIGAGEYCTDHGFL